ncbi:MAG TPA: helix-turn-helix transcriptional regulator [Mycobacterium sp.]|jgi:transcriptional regulator with XRE-family HTH domain|uniref:helix-turn-helix domain-containing protein n=1 Tax=Mycobacterium sp. TaxID=1785 RepID=UPI002F41212A
MESEGHADNRNVGPNLRAIRGSKGLSQTWIAREMNALGWPWHQTTVGRVESGAQVPTHGEMVDLAAVLGVTPERLVMPSEGASEIAAIEKTADSLRLSWIDAMKAVRSLRRAVRTARDALPGAEASSYERVREIAGSIAADLEQYTLEAALAEAEKSGDS